MQNFANRRSVQKCAQNAGSNVLKQVKQQRDKKVGQIIITANEKIIKCILTSFNHDYLKSRTRENNLTNVS